jgi:hypothetical protein
MPPATSSTPTLPPFATQSTPSTPTAAVSIAAASASLPSILNATDDDDDDDEAEYLSFIRAKEQALGLTLLTPTRALTATPPSRQPTPALVSLSGILEPGATMESYFIHKHISDADHQLRFARRLYGYVNEDEDYHDTLKSTDAPDVDAAAAAATVDDVSGSASSVQSHGLSELLSPPRGRKASLKTSSISQMLSSPLMEDIESDDEEDDLDSDDSRIEGWLAKQAITKKIMVSLHVHPCLAAPYCTHQLINLPINLPTNQSINQSINQSH